MIEEIQKRKTFGIISHPDAGKTTLTEKLLLFGGAIQTAGAVKSNKIKKTATSDFMEIEKQRGISVATSVMSFEYNGFTINLLDTPGHKDFAEDTYRTLTAVDSAILVIDCVKGVEEQTEKLMGVCRMRNTPVMTFINKVDREGQNPFDLLDEIEQKLNIKTIPLTFPIGIGATFKGVYNIYTNTLYLFNPNKTNIEKDIQTFTDIYDKELDIQIEPKFANQLREDVELIHGVYDKFNVQDYLDGKVAPVFFGSALNNFGVQELLDVFTQIAPYPLHRETDVRKVEPEEAKFTGFVFKIHANIDPKHRDRLAFVRVCSGKFERNAFYTHTRLGKKMRFSNPATFLASTKSIVDVAYPGDVIGLYDSGSFKIGDTLTEGEILQFKGIPSFSPELFKELVNLDPMKSKQLEKGIRQLTDEGVAQLFLQHSGTKKIVGTVGELQFEVIEYRLLNEYDATCRFNSINIHKACWITYTDNKAFEEFARYRGQYLAMDKDDNPVFLAESPWILNTMIRDYPDLTFHFNSEFKV